MERRSAGRPRKTDGPFVDVCRTENSIYIVELGNGMVKVGFSNNPRSRLHAVACFCRRVFKSDVSRFHVYSGAGTRRLESRCIRAVAQVADLVPLTTDYFTGIPFGEAKAIVEATMETT